MEKRKRKEGLSRPVFMEGACSSVGSALCSYAKRRAFDIFYAPNGAGYLWKLVVRFGFEM